jgi:hypothetical protein
MTAHRPFSWTDKPSGKCCRENQNIFYMKYIFPKIVPYIKAKKSKLTASRLWRHTDETGIPDNLDQIHRLTEGWKYGNREINHPNNYLYGLY